MSNPDSARRFHYLNAMGIQTWLRRGQGGTNAVMSSPSSGDPVPASAAHEASSPLPYNAVATLDWMHLRQRVLACTQCALHKGRTQAVFGVGNQQARWMIIGEAPGADEDRQGEPFVGRAGKLLNNMLLAVGLKREDAYIANIVKCRPPNNRDPQPEEADSCAPYLQRQIALIQPKLILAVGRIAAQNLLNTTATVGALRGKCQRYGEAGIPLVVTYHPAYLLRSPKEKRKAWRDLQLAREIAAPVLPNNN